LIASRTPGQDKSRRREVLSAFETDANANSDRVIAPPLHECDARALRTLTYHLEQAAMAAAIRRKISSLAARRLFLGVDAPATPVAFQLLSPGNEPAQPNRKAASLLQNASSLSCRICGD
jgi:hypothetical protein